MCIIAIAWHLFDKMPLILLSNRDEFLQRPTTPAHQWPDAPIFAGRDGKDGGTWLGIQQQAAKQRGNPNSSAPADKRGYDNRNEQHYLAQPEGVLRQNGRWAAVLNYRDGVAATAEQRSRGALVSEFLSSDLSPLAYARHLNLHAYAGFNLIVGDSQQAVLVNNRGYPPTPLPSGLHLVSNGDPDSDWFKCARLRGRVRQEVLPLIAQSLAFADGHVDDWQAAAWQVLSDTCQATQAQLPHTGLDAALEQALSAICIDTPQLPAYGTRTQSILSMRLETGAELGGADGDGSSLNRPKLSKAHRPPLTPVLTLSSREYRSS